MRTFIDLEINWKEYFCENCNSNHFYKKNIFKCKDCGKEICIDCMYETFENKDVVCEKCYYKFSNNDVIEKFLRR